MDEQKKGFIDWIKAHKKELIIAGISIATLTGIILCIKNRASIEALWKSLIGAIEESSAVMPKVSHLNIEKIEQTTVTVPSVIIPTDINAINTTRTFQHPFEVSDHIRNLHTGWSASAEKLAEAKAMGIVLLPGQTLVGTYTKGGVAA